MTGLCSHCHDNAVANPADDLCADCRHDVDSVVTELRSPGHSVPCVNGRAWCFGANSWSRDICDDCADLEYGDAA